MRSSPVMAAIVMTILLRAAMAAAGVPDVILDDHGRGASLHSLRNHQPMIIVFWRSDCAPCLQELAGIADLRREASPLRVMLINLQSPEELRDSLPSADVPSGDAWRALTPAREALVAFGGEPPRLPLSVLVDGAGRIRAKRVGLLGPLLAREWRSKLIRKDSHEKS